LAESDYAGENDFWFVKIEEVFKKY